MKFGIFVKIFDGYDLQIVLQVVVVVGYFVV